MMTSYRSSSKQIVNSEMNDSRDNTNTNIDFNDNEIVMEESKGGKRKRNNENDVYGKSQLIQGNVKNDNGGYFMNNSMSNPNIRKSN